MRQGGSYRIGKDGKAKLVERTGPAAQPEPKAGKPEVKPKNAPKGGK